MRENEMFYITLLALGFGLVVLLALRQQNNQPAPALSGNNDYLRRGDLDSLIRAIQSSSGGRPSYRPNYHPEGNDF